MCAIFGIGFMKGHKITNSRTIRKIVASLFTASQERGRLATGIAITDHKDINVLKSNITASRFIQSPDYISFSKSLILLDGTAKRANKSPISIIGHCRLPTKGAPSNNHNNHPIVANDIVGVHNGIIYNDDNLFELWGSDKCPMERRGQVDSEVIFRLINYFADNRGKTIAPIKETSNLIMGSYACACVNANNPYLLYLFRNSGPIDIVSFPEVGIIVFASSAEYIHRSTAIARMGRAKKIDCPANSGVAVNFSSNSIHHFKINMPENRRYWNDVLKDFSEMVY